MSNKYDMGESIIGAILSGGPFYQNPIVLISIFIATLVVIHTAKTNNRR